MRFPHSDRHPRLTAFAVHRLGRTGRVGKTGLSTHLINQRVPMSALLALKRLFIEGKQRLPKVLAKIADPALGQK